MIAALVLPQALRAQIEAEARAAFPRECCGLIEGRRDGDVIRAIALHPARNLATDADRFEIDPADHFRALHKSRANGHEIVGCYHSHPNGVAKPSSRDIASAIDEQFVWLLCAINNSETKIAAFLHQKRSFRALNLRNDPNA
jgi:proteasome lid subunit RPN8/RPN11